MLQTDLKYSVQDLFDITEYKKHIILQYLAPGWLVDDWFCISNFLFSLSSSAKIATLFLFWKPKKGWGRRERDKSILDLFLINPGHLNTQQANSIL